LRWALLGAPLDSSGEGRGEERAPAALRAAGLAEAFGARDLGDACPPLRDPVRDPVSGVIAFEQLRAASASLHTAVGETLARGERPLVVGGDCTLLLGALPAADDALGALGLWFVDGHADYFDGQSSPSGEAADMELAQLTGGGPLVDRPVLAPENVVILGHRPPGMHPDVALELDRVPASMPRMSSEEIEAAGAAVAGSRWAAELGSRGACWLHLDLDALDSTALPAVSYPQERGLDWDAFVALVRPLLASDALVGASVADFNPDLDADGSQARRVVEALQASLRPRA